MLLLQMQLHMKEWGKPRDIWITGLHENVRTESLVKNCPEVVFNKAYCTNIELRLSALHSVTQYSKNIVYDY